MRPNYRGLIVMGAIAGMVGLSGCSVTPELLSPGEARLAVEERDTILTANQAPVDGPIDFYEAVARALKYNLDFKVEVAERVQRLREADLTEYSQWPQLMANAGFTSRNNENASSSFSLSTNTFNFGSSTSTDQDVGTGSLSLSWNILDFGLSYIRAQQAADRILVAQEEERKVVNRVVQDVRSIYWRAVTAQKLLPQLYALLNDVDDAIDQLDIVVGARLETPLNTLNQQRELLDIRKRAEQLINDLSLSKTQLAALMNLRPGTQYELFEELPEIQDLELDLDVNNLEILALQKRPELRTFGYNQRIAAKEGRAALLEMIPSLRLFTGLNYNSNQFLQNQNWVDAGLQVSWNAFNVFRYPAVEASIESRKGLLKAQRLSLSMAVITQVHVSLARHGTSSGRLQTANRFLETQQAIQKQTDANFELQEISRHIRLRERMNTIIAQTERDVAYADVQNAFATLVSSVGLDPLPNRIDDAALPALQQQLRDHWAQLQTGRFISALAQNEAETLGLETSAEPVRIQDLKEFFPTPAPSAIQLDQARTDALLDQADLNIPVSAEIPETKWVLQVGSFLEEERALGLKEQLERWGLEGIRIYRRRADINTDSIWHSVVVEGLQESEAQTLKVKIDDTFKINSLMRSSI